MQEILTSLTPIFLGVIYVPILMYLANFWS